MTELPSTMRAALLLGRGGPEMLEVRDDVAVPEVGPTDVLIEVAACGVNNTDINTRVGWYSRSVTGATSGEGFDEARSDDATWGRGGIDAPRIQGADPSGRVVAVGRDVDGAGLLGRRVLVDPWLRDPADPTDRSRAGYLGSERDGGFAEYCAVPAANAHPHDLPFGDVDLASIACSWSTAEHMLQRVRLTVGQTIAVTGASGGVGSALVQLAAARGARVVAVCGAAKAAAVRDLGADEVIERELDDVAATAEAVTGGVDVVADVVGGPDFGPWLDVLRKGGRYVTSGAIAGPVVDLDLRTLYLNDLELYGATVFGPQVFADLMTTLATGDVRPVVAEVFPLDGIHDAQAAFGRKEHVGAIVVQIN